MRKFTTIFFAIIISFSKIFQVNSQGFFDDSLFEISLGELFILFRLCFA